MFLSHPPTRAVKIGADAVSVYTVEEEVGVWGVGGALRSLSRTQSPPSAEGQEHRGRGGSEVLERQTTRVQSGKASSRGSGRADAASCGGDRGRALRKVLVSGGEPDTATWVCHVTGSP